MATPKRPLFKGAAYHVTVRTVDGRAAFVDDAFRLAFLGRLGREIAERGLVCDAYCLMTNHFHLLVRTPQEGLPEAMQRLNTWFAVSYNQQLNRRGRVLEAPYRARLIETDRHFLGTARYLPLNPVRARMVESPADYEWSSFPATAGLAARPAFLTTEWILAQLGGAERYRAFVEAGRGVRSLDEILLA
jgi:REP element-mobilizing transposase RayT